MVLQYQTYGLPLHANVYEVLNVYLKGIAEMWFFEYDLIRASINVSLRGDENAS